MTKYEHSQIGHTIVWIALGAAVFVAMAGTFAPGSQGASLITELILVICALLFCKLTIKVDDQNLRWSFGIGIVRKRVPLAEIVACEPIRIPWGWGWGIHLTPHGWLYNVSGLHAVAIKLRSGRKFALGTDDPQRLTAAIQRFSAMN